MTLNKQPAKLKFCKKKKKKLLGQHIKGPTIIIIVQI